MATTKDLLELGHIIHKDKGRFPWAQLGLWGTAALIVMILWYGWEILSHWSASPRWFDASLLVPVIIAIVIVCFVVVAIRWRSLIVCEHGLVRYIRILGPKHGHFVIIDFAGLLAQTLLTTEDTNQVRKKYDSSTLPDGSSFNEATTGPGIAFLARNRETMLAIRGDSQGARERMRTFQGADITAAHATGQPLDPRIGVACWTHATHGSPDEVMRVILQAMVRDGYSEAVARLNKPASYRDPLWEQFSR